MSETRDDDDEDTDVCPAFLTKTKLYTIGADDGEGSSCWTEIGVGIAAVNYSDDPSDDNAAFNTETSTATLTINSIDPGEEEVLLSTPVVVDDIYFVQRDAILVWSDPEIGREMACSFSCAEGCMAILEAIRVFQRRKMKKKPAAAAAAPAAVATARALLQTATASPVSPNNNNNITSSGLITRTNSDDSGHSLSPWSVHRQNLPALLLALRDNQKRFGTHVRDTPTFIADIGKLFNFCTSDGDIVGKDHIGKICYALISPPFSSEGKIMSQFISEENVEDVIDMVQWSIGRKSPETGYLSREARRATFKDPLRLPVQFVKRVHLLYNATFLRDLVPLLLEDGDAAGCTSTLTVLLLRFKFALLGDIVRSERVIGAALVVPYFQNTTNKAVLPGQIEATGSPLDNKNDSLLQGDLVHDASGVSSEVLDYSKPNAAWGFELLALLHDAMRCIKNSMIPLEPKEDLFVSAVENGLFNFITDALRFSCLGAPSTPTSGVSAPTGADGTRLPVEAQFQPNEVGISMCCDIVANVLMFAPGVREELLRSAQANPLDCLLRYISIAVVISGGRTPAAQSAADAFISAGIGLIQSNAPVFGPKVLPFRREVLRYMCEGYPVLAVAVVPTMQVQKNGSSPLLKMKTRSAVDDRSVTSLDTNVAPAAPSGEIIPTNGVSHLPMAILFAKVSSFCQAAPIENASSCAALCHQVCNTLKVLAVIVADSAVFTKYSFIQLYDGYKISDTLTHILKLTRHNVKRVEGGTSIRPTALSFIAALIESNVECILQSLVTAGVVAEIVEEYLYFARTNRHMKTLAASTALRVLHQMHETVHKAKSIQVTGSIRPASTFGTSSFRFISEIEDSNNAMSPTFSRPVSTVLVCHVVSTFKVALQEVSPALLAKFVRAAEETAVEAAQSEDDETSSSRAQSSSHNLNVGGITDAEFTAMLKEFGPDAPQEDICPTSPRGSEISLDELEKELSGGGAAPSTSGSNEAALGEAVEPVFLLRRSSRVTAPAAGSSAVVAADGECEHGDDATVRKKARTELA